MRLVRDPIHGDIPLDPISAVVVDHVAFQRLRYIRQNGLLHFVFPGAVHTRFIHSIGTLANAEKLIAHLLAPAWRHVSAGTDHDALHYVATTFRLAALLHDVGHCAFSHSIERIKTSDGKPLLGTVRELAAAWGEGVLSAERAKYLSGNDEAKARVWEDATAEHEVIGFFIIKKIFSDASIAKVSNDVLKVDGPTLGRDVAAVLGHLPPSTTFSAHIRVALGLLKKACTAKEMFGDLDPSKGDDAVLRSLHGLISGTLDVDRLDYLLRDAHFCGVPYGKIDPEIIIRCLHFVGIGGELEVALAEKGVHALEDMLWSRYQMFLQVYNHKTNVALNGLLAIALPEAIDDKRIEPPRTYEDYLGFSDDYVMSAIFRVCSTGKLKDKVFGKALVHRKIPRHLGYVDLLALKAGGAADPIAAALDAKVKETGIEAAKLIACPAPSAFHKDDPLPHIIRFAKPRGEYELVKLDEVSKLLAAQMPPACNFLHVFVE